MTPRYRGFVLAGTVTLFIVGAIAPVYGHQHTAPWLLESELDNGLFVEVRHPRVIRSPRPFDVSVVVNNLLAEGEVVVTGVRYDLPGAFDTVRHRRRHVLAEKRADYRRYKRIQRELRGATERRDRRAVRRLRAESRSHLARIASGVFRDRQTVEASYIPEVGSRVEISVEVDVVERGVPRTLRRRIEILVHPPLPAGSDGSWFSGDQHLHTAFSIDAFFLDGTTELLADYAATAQTVGLDWIVVTDHTNVRFLLWYRPWMFAIGELAAKKFRDNRDYLVLQGQEMAVGSLGRFGESAHLLVYPHKVDSTGFIPNPCSGLIANHVNCEPEQVILDRVNDNGGISFIAHPFDAAPLLFAAWDQQSDAQGWAGLEIFNSRAAVVDSGDEKSIDWWHELLNEIEPPQDGLLSERPDFPTRFPVGIGNSDAHQPGHIGNTFTYARLPGVLAGNGMLPREDVMDAFVAGRLVASNGPLVFGEVNGAGVGEVAMLLPGSNQLAVTLQTTPEFGLVGDYTITVLVNGSPRAVVPLSGSSSFETTIVLEDLLAPPDKFVTIRARCDSCSGEALANPIWLEFPTATATE